MNFEGTLLVHMQSAAQGNDFELIPTVKMERGDPAEGPLGRKFSSICNVAE